LTQKKAEIAVLLIGSAKVQMLVKNYLLTPFLMHFKMMGAAGVLGYLFLALLPWLLFGNKNKDPVFKYFLILSIAGFIAFIFTVHFIRYFMPVIPFLSLVYAMSISENNWLSPKAGCSLAAIFVSINMFILFQHVNEFRLLSYSLGTADREEFLKPLVDYYKAAQYLKNHASPDSKILLVGEGRTYYFEQECFGNYPEQPIIIEKWIIESGSLPKFIKMLKEKQVQFVLFNHSEMQRIAEINHRIEFFTLQNEYRKILDEFLTMHLQLIYDDEVIAIFKMTDQVNQQ
jgi:hypothetical protein